MSILCGVLRDKGTIRTSGSSKYVLVVVFPVLKPQYLKIINPPFSFPQSNLGAWFWHRKQKVFAFYVTHRYWYVACCLDLLSRKTCTSTFHLAIIMAADGLATQGARTSAAMWLAWCSRNIPVPVYRKYRKISNISRTKSQNLNISRLGLQLSLRNIL